MCLRHHSLLYFPPFSALALMLNLSAREFLLDRVADEGAAAWPRGCGGAPFSVEARRPFRPMASKRGPPNNGNLLRATQKNARSRCESAGAARHERACRASRECPRSREAIGLSSGRRMRASRKQSHRSNQAVGKERWLGDRTAREVRASGPYR